MKKNGRLVEVSPEAVVRALVGSEIRYLTVAEAGPWEMPVQSAGLPKLDAAIVRQALGRMISSGRPKDVQRYVLPNQTVVARVVRAERDRLLMSHTRQGRRVREQVTGHFCAVVDFEVKVAACNRLMAMLRAA